MFVSFLRNIKHRENFLCEKLLRDKLKKFFSTFLVFVFIMVNFFGVNIHTAYATDAWWDVSYGYRVKITINSSQVPSTQTNFPVYVNLANLPAGFWSNVKSDGSDIRVTNSSGTELAREVVAINTGTSAGELWFKANSISDASYYYIYYGKPSATEPTANSTYGSQNVWDSNYVSVHHLKETGTNPTVYDSTSNANTSNVNTWTPTASSKVGSGGQLVSGTNHIEFPDSSSFDSINTNNAVTLSMWINWTGSTESYNTLLGRYGASSGSEIMLKSNGKLAWYVNNAGNNIDGTGTNTLVTGSWYYITAVYSTSGGKVYVNGNQDASVGYGSAVGTTTSVPMQIGHDQFGSGRYYRGYFDEARISNIVRAPNWITTEYNNQNSTTTFYSVAAQEAITAPDAPTGLTATTGNTQISLSWTAPVNNGGSAITDYVIDYKLTSEPTTWSTFADGVSTGTTGIVTGLTNGLSYDFRVSAVNTIGQGSSSTTTSATPATVPDAPTIGTATAGNGQVSVAFSSPSNGGSTITGYTVTSSPGGFTGTGATSPIIVSGLTNGTSYTFTVTATNAIGTGSASGASNSATPAAPPGIPTAVSATADNAQVSLSWSAPASNGGSAVTDYVIEYKLATEPTVWSVFSDTVSTSTTGTVTGLTNGLSYDFRISAVNTAGQGSPSTPAVSSTPRTVPDQPTITSVTRGNGEVTVNFSAPSFNGGSAITEYTVTSTPSGITQTGSSSPITIGGLTNGTPYTFTVKATNVAGTGTDSSSSSSVTPATTPGKATQVTAVAGNAQATITFTAPSSNGGSAITGYVVTSSNGGTDSNSGSTSLSHVVTGLTNGAAYTFTVVATNDVGSGLASDPSDSVTLPSAPTAPLNLAAEVKSSSIRLTWSSPTSNGGSNITDYIIEYQLTTGGNWAQFNDGTSTNTFTTVTGLSNGTSYDFRVSAVNSIGTSVVSNSVSATPGEPAQVAIQSFTDLTNTSIGTAIRITNEGLIEYEYQYTWCVTDAVDNLCGGNDDVFSGSNAKLINSLENYDFTATSTVADPGVYYFHIKVFYGSQSSSAYQSFTAVATYPDPPTDLSATAGNAQALVSFTIPSSNGGSAITGYTATSNPGGLTGTGLTTPITVTGLTNGTAYTFTMTATNSIGTGQSSSATNSVTPATLPGAISSLSASAGDTQVGLSWNAPASNGGSAIIDYVIEYKLSSDSDWSVFADSISTARTITVTGLTNDLSYDFRVSAVNSIGQGPVNSTSATSVVPPPTNTGGSGGSSSGGILNYQSGIVPPTTTAPNIKTIPSIPPTIPSTVPITKAPITSSPKIPNIDSDENIVTITPTKTSHITQPVKKILVDNFEKNKTSTIPWIWISIYTLLILFIGFILRRRRMDDK